MRVVMITPPFFSLAGPAAGPAVLTSTLKTAGHDAISFDMSRFCVERLLSREAIAHSLQRLGPSARDPMAQGFLMGLHDSVAALQRRKTYTDLATYRRHRYVIEQAMATHARAHGRTVWNSAIFSGDHDHNSPVQLLEAVRRGGELLDDTIDAALPVVVSFKPDVVAISLAFRQQLYGALRTAQALKQAGYSGHVTLGGATATRLRHALVELPDFFDLVDSVILREGQTALPRLADAIEARVDPVGAVPDLLVRRDGHVVCANVPQTPDDLDLSPVPDFDDLVPGPYLTPAPLLPVSTTRNCYFNRCAFCAIGRSFQTGFRQMAPTQMVHQMATLSMRQPGAMFRDVSEALAPPIIHQVSKLLASQDPPSWEVYLRFESAFDSADVARDLRRGGLRVAYLGLESASPRVLAAMNKRIAVNTAESTIRHFADAGIWVHLFLMTGFFGETEADHQLTVEFLRHNAPHVHSVQIAPFALAVDSDVVDGATSFGATVRRQTAPTFALELDYDPGEGSPDAATALRRAQELYAVAYTESRGTLALSREVLDAHKVCFAAALGGPYLPPLRPTLASQRPPFHQESRTERTEDKP